MQHREGHRTRERGVLKGHRRRIPAYDRYIRTRESLFERRGQPIVNLNRRESLIPRSQQIGSQAGTGPHLEHVRAQIDVAEDPRHDAVLQRILPTRRTAQPAMYSIHASPWKSALQAILAHSVRR